MLRVKGRFAKKSFLYSFPRLEWPKTEDPFSRPFVGQNWFRLVLLNRINTADVIGYFFLPTGHFSFAPHIHTPSAIRSFQGISSRPFIGENVFWSVPQNRMSTENAVGCLFLSLTLTFYCFHKFAVPHAAFCSKRPNRISHGSNSDFFWIWHALEGADGVCICGAKEKCPVGKKK